MAAEPTPISSAKSAKQEREPYDWDDEARQDPRKKFPIKVQEKNIPKMSGIAWAGVRKSNRSETFSNSPYLYIRDSMIVELQEKEDDDGIISVVFSSVTPERMTGIVGRSTFWFKEPQGQFPTEVFPEPTIIKDMAYNPHPPLPMISRIVAAPVFSSDGHLSIVPGYNAKTKSYYHHDHNMVIRNVPVSPSDAEITLAIQTIRTVIEEFPFVDSADECHTISLMLNPFVRSMIKGSTPLYMIEAPAQGTGKGKLAEICLHPALNTLPSTLIPTGNDEEMRKRLFSIVSNGHEAIMIDNIDKTINSAELATILTSGVVTDRILGTSKTGSYQIRNTWVATSNNPTMNRDIFRRTVRIRLNANLERPEERVFKKDAVQWGIDHRAELIWSSLVLVQNWIALGMPEPKDNGAPLGSFESWARVHGGILESAGIFGFLHNRVSTDSLSVEEQAIPMFIQIWHERHSGNVVLGTVLLELAKEIPGFPLRGNNDLALSQSFGRFMESIRDRVYGDLQIHREPKSNSGVRWSLKAPQTVMDFGDF